MLDHAFAVADTVRFRVHTQDLPCRRAVQKFGRPWRPGGPDVAPNGEACVYRLGRADRLRYQLKSGP